MGFQPGRYLNGGCFGLNLPFRVEKLLANKEKQSSLFVQ
jgi:hypothetical protein